MKVCCRELLIQVCESQEIDVLKGVVSSDHIHMHIEYAPKLNVSDIVERLKGRSSRRLQQEFPELKKRYWGNHFWASGNGVWSTGNITDKMVDDYLEHHRRQGSSDRTNFILE
ncbi:IS200/IS605 family transposase [Maribacter sp. 2307ULW6-5]|uniref:IS200/IS605 family transposase n=1 Tax=Maribacter sp. 2307ULW6-5 TaxID=3386275 RepID=UPI0039BCA97F